MSQSDVEIVRRLLGRRTRRHRGRCADEAISASDHRCASAPSLRRTSNACLSGMMSGGLRIGTRWPSGCMAGLALAWESYHAGVEDVIGAGDGRVLVLTTITPAPRAWERRCRSRRARVDRARRQGSPYRVLLEPRRWPSSRGGFEE